MRIYDPNDACAESIIQFRLPNGVSVCGGFMGNDIFREVLNFVRCFFQPDKMESISLRYPHSPLSLCTGDYFDQKLKEIGLYPRAVLIVTIITNKQTIIPEKILLDAKDEKIKKKDTVSEERKRDQAYRAKIIAGFKEDHTKS